MSNFSKSDFSTIRSAPAAMACAFGLNLPESSACLTKSFGKCSNSEVMALQA